MSLMGWANLVESVLTSLGIIAAGLWAYFHYFRGRTYRSRLKLAVGGSFFEKEGRRVLRIGYTLENAGLNRVPIQKKGTVLRILAYRDATAGAKGTGFELEHLGTLGVFEDHGWIEPDEVIADERLVAVANEAVNAVRIGLRVVSQGIEWNCAKIILKDQEAKDATKEGRSRSN